MIARAAVAPRLLAGVRPGRSLALPEHVAAHGPLPERGRDAMLAACERGGLLGRGGALFPAAVKLRSVAARRGRTSVVVNAAEGEPMSAKDRALVASAPHLVLDGALTAARTVGAREVVVALPRSARAADAAVRSALAERSDADAVRLAAVPDAFLSGEESALVRFLDGGPALPTVVPPRPDQRGLHGRPTLVLNAETLAHLALIARHGPEWFRAVGTAAHPGSTLVTLGGCVGLPGVHEIAVGTAVDDLLAASGETTEPWRAILVGGFHGTWLDGDAGRVTLDRDGLARYGATLGAGVVVALPQSACPVAEVAATVRWLAGQNARQCGPCVHGLEAITRELTALAHGRADAGATGRLVRWSRQVAGRGACHHPDGATRFLLSALVVFEPEIELHRRFGACEACDRPAVLRTPTSRAVAA